MLFRNGLQARNRVLMAALTNMQSHADGTLSDDEFHWLHMRAQGGFGVVTTCAAHVSRDGQGWKGELAIFDDAHIPGLARLAAALHDSGALGLVQIFHGGLRADPQLIGGRPWSASDAEDRRAATAQDIERVIEDFAAAAMRAHAAGMDGVEIHGAHGYLLTQFLSAVDNRRGDQWGGSLENRARLLRDVVRRVRARVPASMAVGVRLSPEDWGNAKGLDLDESLELARWLCEDGADFLHLSLWTSQKPTRKRPEQHALQLFRQVVPGNVLLWVAGKIWTREDAEQMLELGADGIALGRSAIANPDWALRAPELNWSPKRPPLTPAELRERGLNADFVEYMRTWRDFVTP